MEKLNREYFQNKRVADVSHTIIIFACYFYALHRYVGNCALLNVSKCNDFRSMTVQLVIQRLLLPYT